MSSEANDQVGIELGTSARAWQGQLAVAVIYVALGATWFLLEDGFLGWAFLALGASFAARTWRLASVRVRMTPEAVVVERHRRSTRIPWTEVRDVAARRSFWRGDVVMIVPAHGEPVSAFMKSSWFDDSFERNLGVLRERWRKETGAPTSDAYSAAQNTGSAS